MLILKPIIICIVSLILIMLLKKISPEYVPVVSVITGIMLIIYVFPYIQTVLLLFTKIELASPVFGDVFKILIKIVVVSLMCEFASQLCADSGESYLSGKINFVGKIIILSIVSPNIMAFINYVAKVIKNI